MRHVPPPTLELEGLERGGKREHELCARGYRAVGSQGKGRCMQDRGSRAKTARQTSVQHATIDE